MCVMEGAYWLECFPVLWSDQPLQVWGRNLRMSVFEYLDIFLVSVLKDLQISLKVYICLQCSRSQEGQGWRPSPYSVCRPSLNFNFSETYAVGKREI